MEQSYIMIKPDGVQRGLVGEVIARFENRGYYLRALKAISASKELAEEHYAEHNGKPFYPGLVNYILSGPVIAMVFEGRGIVKAARTMIGATKPLESAPGTIRGDYAQDSGRNIIHGSDSVESAQREIALWFNNELVQFKPTQAQWIFEN